MPERRKQPARLREFKRLARRLDELEREHASVTETVAAMIDLEPTLDDPATDGQVAAALGIADNTVRVRRKRIRERLTHAGK